MKILISSKHLASKLNKIDFEKEQIFQVLGESSSLTLCTQKQNIDIYCDILRFSPRIKQDERRWDWVKDLVNKADEQPMVLDISENLVKVIFAY